MIRLFLEELLARRNSNASSFGSLSSITPPELKFCFCNELNTHWPYLLPSYCRRNIVSDIIKYKLEMILEAWAITLACLSCTFANYFSFSLFTWPNCRNNGVDSWTIWLNQAILSSEWNKWSYFIQAHGNWSLCYLKKIEGFKISSKSTKWWKAHLFLIHK